MPVAAAKTPGVRIIIRHAGLGVQMPKERLVQGRSAMRLLQNAWFSVRRTTSGRWSAAEAPLILRRRLEAGDWLGFVEEFLARIEVHDSPPGVSAVTAVSAFELQSGFTDLADDGATGM